MGVGKLPTVSKTAPRPEQPAERRGQATGELGGSGRELPGRQEGEGSGRWAQPLQKRSRTFKDKEPPGGGGVLQSLGT